MGEADWTLLTDGLDTATVRRGVTYGVARPNGGGNFVFGFNSVTVAEGAVAYFTNQAGFIPTTLGGSVMGAIQRGEGGGATNFAPFFLVGIQGTSVNDFAYLFGLGDDDPHHIILQKGVIASGLDDLEPDPDSNGVLLRSTSSYEEGTWHHVRLDWIVNDNGDVLLQCFENDLDTNPVTAPVWTAIPGMTEFIDDTLQVATGSAPYTSGRIGFGFYTKDISRRGYFDHIACYEQL